MSEVHATRPVQVWVDVDVGIADLVVELNAHPGVRTYTSCEGVPGYRPAYVMVGWLTREALDWLKSHYHLHTPAAEASWAYLHPEGA